MRPGYLPRKREPSKLDVILTPQSLQTDEQTGARRPASYRGKNWVMKGGTL
jgi:hypothetical protein